MRGCGGGSRGGGSRYNSGYRYSDRNHHGYEGSGWGSLVGFLIMFLIIFGFSGPHFRLVLFLIIVGVIALVVNGNKNSNQSPGVNRSQRSSNSNQIYQSNVSSTPNHQVQYNQRPTANFCSACGIGIFQNSEFCTECGTKTK